MTYEFRTIVVLITGLGSLLNIFLFIKTHLKRLVALGAVQLKPI